MKVAGWLSVWLIAALLYTSERNGFGSDSQWDDTFFSHGGIVNALVVDEQGYVYAGGEFGGIAELNAFPGTRNLAQGDGQRWWQVGGGLNGRVNALALKAKDLYVGGSFTQAGTNAARSLARWDGSNWWAVGTGVTGEVMALAFEGSDLYVGGRFTSAGDLVTQGLAKWDGSNWSDFGGVFLGPNAGTVRAILVHEEKVYIGGDFDRVGTNAVANVACWDGASWHALGSGTNKVPLLRVQALGVDVAGRLYAGGLGDGSVSGRTLFQWSGDRWIATPLGGPGDNTGVRAITSFGNDLYVGAGFFAQLGGRLYPMARFDGTNWNLPDVPFRHTVLAIAATTSRMYVSGNSGIPLSREGFSVMYYDAKEWSVIGKGVADRRQEPPNVINTLGSNRGFIVAGGRIRYGGFGQQECIAAWNGKIWSPFEPFQSQSFCSEVLTVDSAEGRLLAGTVDGLKSWNGTNWVTFGTGGPSTVRAIAVIGQEIYCGTPSGLWRWDGVAWAPFGITGNVNALLYDQGVLYAGGAFTNAGGVAANNIAQWDGFQWQGLSEGVNGPVHCLANRGAALYAGGQFSIAGATAAEGVAAWNGTNWSAMGRGLSGGILGTGTVAEGVVRALTVSDHGVLYAGGNFTQADGLDVNHIAMWNGRHWLPLGGGVKNFVRALLWHENKLYVGGEFSYAGDGVSSRIAVWHEAPSLSWSYLADRQQSVFSWPADFSDYVLEAANELPTSQWTTATNEVFIYGNQLVTTNSIVGERQFFRLRRD